MVLMMLVLDGTLGLFVCRLVLYLVAVSCRICVFLLLFSSSSHSSHLISLYVVDMYDTSFSHVCCILLLRLYIHSCSDDALEYIAALVLSSYRRGSAPGWDIFGTPRTVEDW